MIAGIADALAFSARTIPTVLGGAVQLTHTVGGVTPDCSPNTGSAPGVA
jgi:hypothetical protein